MPDVQENAAGFTVTKQSVPRGTHTPRDVLG